MTAHLAVLEAAQRLCADRAEPVFTPDEIVRALPHMNAQTIRTHVTSRCCVNAHAHHLSRLEYFRRTERGRYELLARHRLPPAKKAKKASSSGTGRTSGVVRDTVHAVVKKDDGIYVVDCHEIAVVTQGRTLDEALSNLVEAVTLHLDGEDFATFGLDRVSRIHVSYILPATVDAA